MAPAILSRAALRITLSAADYFCLYKKRWCESSLVSLFFWFLFTHLKNQSGFQRRSFQNLRKSPGQTEMLAHIHHRWDILVVYIDCGLKSCGTDIDRFKSVFSWIELFSSLLHSPSLCKDHNGRISCRLVDFWAAASPTLAAVRLTYYLLPVRVCTPLLRLILCMYNLYI